MENKVLEIVFGIISLLFCFVGIMLLIYKTKSTTNSILSKSIGVICLIIGFVIGSMVIKKNFN